MTKPGSGQTCFRALRLAQGLTVDRSQGGNGPCCAEARDCFLYGLGGVSGLSCLNLRAPYFPGYHLGETTALAVASNIEHFGQDAPSFFHLIAIR